MSAKVKIFNDVYVSMLRYGCETWALSERNKSRIQTHEMHAIFEICYGFYQKKELDKMERKQLEWFGNMVRMMTIGTLNRYDRQVSIVNVREVDREEWRNRKSPTADKH